MDQKNHGRRLATALLLIACALNLAGCAAGRALNKPAEKDYDVLEVGTDRDLVRAELGQPMAAAGGGNCDIFSFEEGSGGLKYLRAAGYSLLALGTLGISEMVTNPVEASVGNDKVRVRVCYDAQQSVSYSELLRIGKPPKLMSGSYPPKPAPVAATVPAPVVATTPPPAPVPTPAPVAAEAPAPAAETLAAPAATAVPADVPQPADVAVPPAAPEAAAPAPVAAAEADSEAQAAVQAVEKSLVENPAGEPAAAPAPTN